MINNMISFALLLYPDLGLALAECKQCRSFCVGYLGRALYKY